tara:strand:+ start:70 stop:426 length:357 start_codon:yes stop_codon:yes gene_type:complete
MSEYRTQKQFDSICDSMWNGQWSQAAGEVVEYSFWENDLLKAYDQKELYEDEYDEDRRILKGLVTLAQMSAQIRHAEHCDFRPCKDCGEHGTPVPKDGRCKRCTKAQAYYVDYPVNNK